MIHGRSSPLAWIGEELERLDEMGLRRRPPALSGAQGPEVEIGGRRVVLACSNNYLGLADDPRTRRAAADAAARWGAGAGASRLVSGTTELHLELEKELARHKGCEDAVLFSSGYLANVGTIQALVDSADAVFSDELNHASIIDGCRLSQARPVVYRHGDPADLDRLLRATSARRRLVVTDTVFSMDGDLAPVAELLALCRRHGAMLMVDEAHATGLLGPQGGGAVEAAGLTGRVDVVMGTLSKALGSAGGYVAGRRPLVEWLRNRARTYIFDTAPSPAAAGAAMEALRIVRSEPRRRARVLEVARRLSAGLRSLGYEVTEPAAAVVPVMVGEADEAMTLSTRLLELGVYVPAIRPPSVPAGSSRLRVTAMASHTDDHIERALGAFAEARKAGRRPDRGGAGEVRNGPVLRLRPASRLDDLDPRLLGTGGVFITGTDTGVGKTVVGAAIARCLASAGLTVGAMKVAQTGGDFDIAFLRTAGGVPHSRTYVPYSFPDPLAPALAARRKGRRIDLERIEVAFRRLRAAADVIVVEGAGGLLVPLADDATMADLASKLGLPVVVVARPTLGTINHTALTVGAAVGRGLEVMGVVLCRFPAAPGLAEATNPGEIERATGACIVGCVPDLEGLDTSTGAVPACFDPAPWLAPALGGLFDPAGFLRGLEEGSRHDARA